MDDLVLVVAMVIPFTVPKPGMLTKLLFWALFAILIARVDKNCFGKKLEFDRLRYHTKKGNFKEYQAFSGNFITKTID